MSGCRSVRVHDGRAPSALQDGLGVGASTFQPRGLAWRLRVRGLEALHDGLGVAGLRVSGLGFRV